MEDNNQVEITEKSSREPTILVILAGCFAVFTIGYAIFNYTTNYFLEIQFDKDSIAYRSCFVGAYILVNVIFWPILKKRLRSGS